MRALGIALLTWLWLTSVVIAQPWAQPTKQSSEKLASILASAEKMGAVVSRPAFRVIDSKCLRSSIALNLELITDPVCDVVVIRWRDSQSEEKKAWLEVLRALVEAKPNDRTHGFVALFTGNACSFNPNEYEVALQQYEEAVRRFRAAKASDWQAAVEVEIGNYWMAFEKFIDAEKAYCRARELYRDSLGENHVLVCDTLMNLGNVHHKCARFEEAVRNYQQCIERLRKTPGDQDLRIAACLQNLGTSLTAKDDDEGAVKALRSGLKTIQTRLGADAIEQLPFLDQFALIYRKQNQAKDEEAQYLRALEIVRKAIGSDSAQEAKYLGRLGDVAASQDRVRDALVHHQHALRILRDRFGEDDPLVAGLMAEVGDDFKKLKEWSKAVEYLKKAFDASLQLPGQAHQYRAATCQSSLASIYESQGNHAESEKSHVRAVEIAQKALGKNNPAVCPLLTGLGLFYIRQKTLDASLPPLREAYEIASRSDAALAIASTADCLGLAYGLMDNDREAEKYHRESIAIYQKLQHPEISKSYADLAGILVGRRDYVEALKLLRVAVQIRQNASGSDDPRTLHLYGMLATTLLASNEPKEALHAYRKIHAALAKKHGDDHAEVAKCLFATAEAYRAAGEVEDSLKICRDALSIFRKNSKAYAAETLRAMRLLASLHADTGDHAKAVAILKEARRDFEPYLSPREKAEMLIDCGCRLRNKSDFDAAEQHFLDALEVFLKIHGERHKDVAWCWELLAQMNMDRNQLEKAMRNVDRALAALERDAAPNDDFPWQIAEITARVLGLKAELYARQALPLRSALERKAALRLFDQAGEVLTRVRYETRTSAESKLELIDLLSVSRTLLRLGLCESLYDVEKDPVWLQAAFRICEENRARVFLEQLGHARSNQIGALPPGIAAAENGLLGDIAKREGTISKLQNVPVEKRDRVHLENLMAEQRKSERELDALRTRLEREYPIVAAMRRPRPCTLTEASSCLRANEIAIIYALGSNTAYALVIEGTARANDESNPVELFPLPLPRQFAERVAVFTESDTVALPARHREIGAEIYKVLMAPLANRIQNKDLVIVPDNVLWTFPFETLIDSEDRFLIEKHAVRYAPSMTSLYLVAAWDAKRNPKPSQSIWALGDPTYETTRARASKKPEQVDAADKANRELALREGRDPKQPEFSPLPASADEVRALANLFGPDASEVLLGPGATEAAVKQASEKLQLAKHRYVHFASHGILGFGSNQQPALVLSQIDNDGSTEPYGINDGFLRLSEVSRLKLNANLVVLSACRTGRGQMRNGEGVMGLGQAFMFAGSRGVVCSLWPVGDRATAELMIEFYRGLQNDIRPADALRKAQLSMIRAGKSPRQWAPFILIGE